MQGRKQVFSWDKFICFEVWGGKVDVWERNGGVADEVSRCGREGQLLEERKNKKGIFGLC